MQSVKKRVMLQLNLATGEISKEYVNVPCTLPKYIRAINGLNHNAKVYGVVYLPDDECEEYLRYVTET